MNASVTLDLLISGSNGDTLYFDSRYCYDSLVKESILRGYQVINCCPDWLEGANFTMVKGHTTMRGDGRGNSTDGVEFTSSYMEGVGEGHGYDLAYHEGGITFFLEGRGNGCGSGVSPMSTVSNPPSQFDPDPSLLLVGIYRLGEV